MKKSFYILLFIIILVCSSYKSYSGWKLCETLPPTVFTSLIVGNNIFVGTEDGVYLSIYGSNSWTLLNTKFLFPGDGNVFSFGTLDCNIFAGSTSGGVSLSTDNGKSWKLVNNGLPYYSASDSSITILSFTSINNKMFTGTNNGVYLTTDNGNNWNITKGKLFDSARVNALATLGNKIFAGTSKNGLYMSSDEGNSWNSITNGIPDSIRITTIAIKENNIFAGTYSNGLYVSNDKGNSWRSVTNDKGLTNKIQVSAFYIDSINNIIYAGIFGHGNVIFYSTDDGNSWNTVNQNGLAINRVSTIFKSGNNLFVGSYDLPLYYIPISELGFTSVKETTASSQLTISPNPASDMLNINGNINNYSIKIYNIEGIKQIEAENTKEIDISKLPQGVYYIQIGNYFTKFVKI